jgi:ADP-ribose pyrophosphatase YjhB (NUDIX family)
MDTSAESFVMCGNVDGSKTKVAVRDLRWRPSIYAVVVHDGKLLVSKEQDRYTLPGGGINLGELPEDALLREVKEETGVDVRNPQLLDCRSDFFVFNSSKQGKYAQTLLLYYSCSYIGGDLSLAWLPEEDKSYHDMPEWVALSDLAELPIMGRYDWRPLVMEMVK